MTQQINGAIGYVEYAYAMENHMIYTKMINSAGKTLEPTTEAFEAGGANAKFSAANDFYTVPTDAPGEKSWPITAVTWVIMRTDYPADRNEGVLKFFDWSLKSDEGHKLAKSLDYVPLPPNVVSQIEASWTQWFKGQDGKPIWTASAR